MSSAKLFVLTKAKEGMLAELDQWYGGRHIPDLLAVPGLDDSARYDVEILKAPAGAPGWDYLSVYSIEADDFGAVIADMRSRMGTDRMPMSPALDSDQTVFILARPKDTDQ